MLTKKPPTPDAVPALPPLDPLRRYTLDQALAYLGYSRWSLYADLNAGRIRTVTAGKRRFIPGSEIVRVSALPPVDAPHEPEAA
jgi:hypothetical protein